MSGETTQQHDDHGAPRRVLVTAATGKTGQAVLDGIARLGGVPRALTRDVGRIGRDPSVEVAPGDLRNVDDLVRALDGVDAVYFIAPNVHPAEVEMATAALAACRRAGVSRFVYHSVVHPQLTAMPHHTDKLRVEELVIESGLTWTILQPNTYLQNLDGSVDQFRSGPYRVPYQVDQPFAMVDLRDVGEVAARCAVRRVGIHAVYELSGPEEVSALDVARIASDLLGRQVTAERQDPDDWVRDNRHLDDVPRRRLHAMWAHYDEHGLTGDGAVLEHLLGRRPRDLRGYLSELLSRSPVT